jgi:hypothetical protein
LKNPFISPNLQMQCGADNSIFRVDLSRRRPLISLCFHVFMVSVGLTHQVAAAAEPQS